MIPAADYYDRFAPSYDEATAEPTAWTPPAVVGQKLLDYSQPKDDPLATVLVDQPRKISGDGSQQLKRERAGTRQELYGLPLIRAKSGPAG